MTSRTRVRGWLFGAAAWVLLVLAAIGLEQVIPDVLTDPSRPVTVWPSP